MRNKLTASLLVTLSCLGAAGCEYHGEGLDNPVGRKAVWFSFLSGEDIRQNCAPGAPDHVRLVYNGRWEEQARIYEFTGSAPYVLNQRVLGPADLSHFDLDLAIEPLTGRIASSEMTPGQYQSVTASLDAAIAATPPKLNQMLASDSFYWVASACRGGQFVFDAWQYQSPGYDALAFPAQLMAVDHTGIAFNQAHEPDSMDLANKTVADRKRWYVRVYADRVGGAIGF